METQWLMLMGLTMFLEMMMTNNVMHELTIEFLDEHVQVPVDSPDAEMVE